MNSVVYLVFSVLDCAYGDYTDACYSIERKKCYSESTARNCCDTCSLLANNDQPGMTRDKHGNKHALVVDGNLLSEIQNELG